MAVRTTAYGVGVGARLTGGLTGLGPGPATLVIALTAVCFGLVPLFARELQSAGVSSPVISFYRFFFSGLIMLPFLPVSREKRGEAVLMTAAGLVNGVGWIGYLEAIKTVPVAAAGVIYMSYPLFAVLFAWLLVGQRPGRRSLGAGLLVIAAAALTLSPGALPAAQIPALLIALPAPIAFGLVIVMLSAKIKGLTTAERLACGMLGSVVGLAPLAFGPSGGPVVPSSLDVLVLVLGITAVTAFVPQFLYTAVSPRVGPARAAATGSLELPTMFAVGWLAFGEAVGWREIAAAAMVTAAILAAPSIKPDAPASSS